MRSAMAVRAINDNTGAAFGTLIVLSMWLCFIGLDPFLKVGGMQTLAAQKLTERRIKERTSFLSGGKSPDTGESITCP